MIPIPTLKDGTKLERFGWIGSDPEDPLAEVFMHSSGGWYEIVWTDGYRSSVRYTYITTVDALAGLSGATLRCVPYTQPDKETRT